LLRKINFYGKAVLTVTSIEPTAVTFLLTSLWTVLIKTAHRVLTNKQIRKAKSQVFRDFSKSVPSSQHLTWRPAVTEKDFPSCLFLNIALNFVLQFNTLTSIYLCRQVKDPAKKLK